MPIESNLKYLGDLNPLWPTPADPKSDGDDHLREIKAALRQCFAGFTGTVLIGGADTGAVDAFVLTPATPLLAYTENMMVVFKPKATSTAGAPTLNISGLGAKTIQAVDGSPLLPGDLPAGRYVVLIYDGTAFRLAAITKGYVDQLAFNTALPNQPGGTAIFELTTVGGTTSWTPADIYSYPLRIAQVLALSLSLS
jgi:hypothetical protein